MGKSFCINISNYLFDIIMKPIRKKEDLIIILLESIKAFQMGNIISDTESKGTLTLKINKMSRLIFETENKFFSFNFPFTAKKSEKNDDTLKIYDSNMSLEIDSSLVAVLLSLFKSNSINTKSLDELYYELADIEIGISNYDINYAWLLLKKIFLFETGYIRYDYDPEHENGLLHPLNHLDVYYSSDNTFKIGLNQKISLENFIDILDLETNCYYFKKN